MNLRRLKKLIALVGYDVLPALILFHLAIAAGGYGLAATFGYLTELAASKGYLLHAAGHSFVAAFGAVTTTVLLWQSLRDGRRYGRR